MKKLILLVLTALIFSAFTYQEEIKSIIMPVANTIAIESSDTKEEIILKASHVVPSDNQYSAIKNEFIAFIHFGPNSFTRNEWGNGMEDPKVFDLKNLNTDQWCKTMKDAQMKMVILTVKHHDGFVLWQSRYTKHGIMSTNFKNGKGDILKELVISCKKYDLKVGIYLSPADLFQIESKDGLYGNLSKYTERTIPRKIEGRPFKNKTRFNFKVDDYNEYFLNQLFELLTEYGEIDEVWFDGATPKTKGGQKYNYLAWKELIHTLAPKAVVFGKEDIRWCGNEGGATRDTEWNIIPYKYDPNTLNYFADITSKDIGSREKLYNAKYLHYQQAETNTSIREGWFYRDDNDQKVRSADDIFDIYERSVGGNSTFLLNIPPNRNGEFSKRDVDALIEVGKRIRKTYGENLFMDAKGPKEVLDNNADTFIILPKENGEIIIETPNPVTINRLLIQESITTHSERVEKHSLDAWVNGAWKEIKTSTNIGYKRILRFPKVTSNKFRVRILQARFYPSISNISAHLYISRPPELNITRDESGNVEISPKKQSFKWNNHNQNPSKNLNTDLKIYYSTNVNAPKSEYQLYNKKFKLKSGNVIAYSSDSKHEGNNAKAEFGPIKEHWKLLSVDSKISRRHRGSKAFDGNSYTFWQSKPNSNNKHFIAIDLGKEYQLKAFTYTPQIINEDGMIESGIIKTSKDGINWVTAESFTFGNLINNPVTRKHNFKNKVSTRYIAIESKIIAGNKKTATIAELDFLLE